MAVEGLESRTLLSATLSDGVLTVTGTAGADRIEVQNRSDKGQIKLELNGRETKYAFSSVTKIVIDGLAGNDVISYSGRDGGLNVPGVLNGGDGDDSIEGGLGNDTITGGNGNDRLQGKNGNDRISGGAGNDWIEGGNGNDTLNGDSGNDDIWGNAGNDRLNGGSGDDDLSGGSGTDVIFGNSGNDDFDNSDPLSEIKDKSSSDNGPNKNP
jgi:Ca2+-binding RTX toxin-like protein